MAYNFSDILSANPIIGAIKDRQCLDTALNAPVQILFLLKGSINDLQPVVTQVNAAGKKLFIHLDLFEGLGKDTHGIAYLKNQFAFDGIITTKPQTVKIAKDVGFAVVQRLFMIDSISYDGGIKSIRQTKPDAVEIMPGILPSIISSLSQQTTVPIVAGGLIRTKQEAVLSLKHGASGISTSNKALWHM